MKDTVEAMYALLGMKKVCREHDGLPKCITSLYHCSCIRRSGLNLCDVSLCKLITVQDSDARARLSVTGCTFSNNPIFMHHVLLNLSHLCHRT